MEFRLPTGEVVLVDDADAGWVNELSWVRTSGAAGKQYVGCYVRINGKVKLLALHRMVLGLTDGKIKADHKNGNGFDNRRENLRPCTHGQNIQNQIRRSPKKTSCFKGVYWNNQFRRWACQIRANKQKHFLGYFTDEEEAARTYNRAAISLHREFASLNTSV